MEPFTIDDSNIDKFIEAITSEGAFIDKGMIEYAAHQVSFELPPLYLPPLYTVFEDSDGDVFTVISEDGVINERGFERQDVKPPITILAVPITENKEKNK